MVFVSIGTWFVPFFYYGLPRGQQQVVLVVDGIRGQQQVVLVVDDVCSHHLTSSYYRPFLSTNSASVANALTLDDVDDDDDVGG